MIEIYASKLSREPLETHPTDARLTLEAWLRTNVPSFQPRTVAPISIHLNGELIEPERWGAVEFGADDQVRIYPEPKGDGFMSILTFGLGSYLIKELLMPATPKQGNPGTGEKLSESTVKGNFAKLNAPIREVSGRRKIYPDHLLPLRRWFADKREQWAEMLLCVGKGSFEIDPGEILIGDTPIAALPDDAECVIYEPGASLGAEQAAEWWHSAGEVGASSTGSAGLELRSVLPVDEIASASAFVFSGATVTIPAGAGAFPAGWAANMVARIESPRAWTVVDGGAGRDIIQGDFTELAPFVGMLIEIVGDNDGLYSVASYTAPVPPSTTGSITLDYSNGSPATALLTGTLQMGIGYRGMRYRITAASVSQISVVRLTDTGADDSAWTGFAALQSNTASVSLDGDNWAGDWAGPFAACPSGEMTTHIEYDLFFPGGLCWVDKKGRRQFLTVTAEIQYRDMEAGGAWTAAQTVYTDNTLDQIGFTHRITLPAMMRPEVRMRRIGADSSDPNASDGMQWYGLRSKLAAPTSYAGVTVMAVRVRGGNRIAAQSENMVAVVATRKLPVYVNGAWTAETATRDIVPFVAHVARSIGYTDNDIDLAELERLGAIWAARGDTYDMAVESAGTVKGIIGDALLAGYADFTIDRGKLRPVRDEPRTTLEHGYSPQNMTDPLRRQFVAVKPDDFSGVDVEYTDAITWQKETVECRLAGDTGARVEKIKLEGVTSRTRAWRIGMRQRMAQKYRRWQYSWSTELDALNSRYMSYCAVSDDVPGYGQSALLLSYAGGVIESSEPLDWSAGGAHVVAVRRPDGTLDGPYAATRVDEYRLSVSGLDFTPDTTWSSEPPHILFGPVNRWSYPVLITSISPSGNGASVEAMNYDPRVYEYDDSAP